jgi:Tfp pilus assembly protein PilF
MKQYAWMLLLTVFVLACGRADQPQSNAASKIDTAAQAKQLIDQGMEYLNQQDVVKAIQSFDNAIKVDPQNPENYMVLGQVYLRLRNYDKAVDTFNAGTRVGPAYGELFYFLGAANAVRFHMADNSQTAELYKNEGILAAKRSIEIFVQEQDEEKFKRALALLKSLEENGEIGKTPPPLQ